jgi:serralysin
MTPMALDIAALQNAYGANTAYASGTNTYTLDTSNNTGTRYQCIWDTGGTDTITNAGSSLACIIDLRAATLGNEVGAGGYVSYIGGIYAGYTIANNVVIENAIGGSANDTLIGNSSANTLTGGAGADTLVGGSGTDTASYSGSSSAVTVNLATNSTGSGSGGDADGDTLKDIWNITGSAYADTLTGDGFDNTLIGGAGDDTLTGGTAGDHLTGGPVVTPLCSAIITARILFTTSRMASISWTCALLASPMATSTSYPVAAMP